MSWRATPLSWHTAASVVQYYVPPESLLAYGPYIWVAVAGEEGPGLLDTGAASSAIDIALAKRLRLPVSGTHETTGVTGTGQYPQFDADLEIPLLETTVSRPLRGLPLIELGHPWDAVIGRDVLCQFEMLINGRTGLIRLEQA